MKTIDISLIELFDQHLQKERLAFKASIVGGTAIMLIAKGQRVTGDIDSLQQIPDVIRTEIANFATVYGLDPNWFNDHVSRNFSEFVRKGEDVYSTLVFQGKSLTLYTPSIKTLLLSKIYPMLDRPHQGKDLQDIESLISAKVVGRRELEDAVKSFEENIRYEDRELLKPSRILVSILQTFIKDTFKI